MGIKDQREQGRRNAKLGTRNFRKTSHAKIAKAVCLCSVCSLPCMACLPPRILLRWGLQHCACRLAFGHPSTWQMNCHATERRTLSSLCFALSCVPHIYASLCALSAGHQQTGLRLCARIGFFSRPLAETARNQKGHWLLSSTQIARERAPVPFSAFLRRFTFHHSRISCPFS